MQCEAGRDKGFGLWMMRILQSLPTLRAPLRYLCLQRGHMTPFTGAVTRSADSALVHACKKLELLGLLCDRQCTYFRVHICFHVHVHAGCRADSNVCCM